MKPLLPPLIFGIFPVFFPCVRTSTFFFFLRSEKTMLLSRVWQYVRFPFFSPFAILEGVFFYGKMRRERFPWFFLPDVGDLSAPFNSHFLVAADEFPLQGKRFFCPHDVKKTSPSSPPRVFPSWVAGELESFLGGRR